MATVTVSGRVDAGTKRLADMYIRKNGTSSAEVIANVWRYIADTGSIPLCNEQAVKRSSMTEKLQALRSRTPKGTPLSSMTAPQLKKELSTRE